MHQLVQTRDPLDEVVVQEEPLEREQRLQVLHLNITWEDRYNSILLRAT